MPKRVQYRRILGQNIRQHRKLAGLTQEQLAELADLHPVYLGAIERGEHNVSLDSLVRVATALKTSVGKLADGI